MKLSFWEKLMGSFFYVGFVTRAPGTVTSLFVFAAAWFMPNQVLWIVLLPVTLLTYYLAFRFEQCMGHDPSCFTFDEVTGSLIVVCCIPHELVFYVGFFIIWRLLDIFKPIFKPVENIKQGIGIVLDDVIGAMITVGIYFLFRQMI